MLEEDLQMRRGAREGDEMEDSRNDINGELDFGEEELGVGLGFTFTFRGTVMIRESDRLRV